MKARKKNKHGTRGQYNGNAKISQSEREQIKRKLAEGKPGVEIAKQHGITPAEVSQIKHGKRYNKRR